MFRMSYIILFGIPIAIIIFFIVSMVMYCLAKKRNDNIPGSYSRAQMIVRLTLFIVSSVMAAILLLIVIGITILLNSIVMYM